MYGGHCFVCHKKPVEHAADYNDHGDHVRVPLCLWHTAMAVRAGVVVSCFHSI